VKRAEIRGAVPAPKRRPRPERILVEHTSVNPNKAAHIGHLRNAILGDTFVRLLRASGRSVAVQNYIDNTGVQVADVIVGFLHLEGQSVTEVAERIARQPRFDYYCWDLYARVTEWYEQDKKNLRRARETLRHRARRRPGGGDGRAGFHHIVGLHLKTMERLGVVYDFLPRESEILHLKFWDAAFEAYAVGRAAARVAREERGAKMERKRRNAEAAEKAEIAEEDQKVIVRSNGTVTYVGKDIAYHLWKFGLLGREFPCRRFYMYPSGHQCWISSATEQGEADAPHFGGVAAIYNVIDSRQAEPQNQVIEALRALGYTQQAGRYTHFSYEMVALTPRCAAELGYNLSEEDRGKSYIEVSGQGLRGEGR
jgi:arginyl-tRNA synthetase